MTMTEPRPTGRPVRTHIRPPTVSGFEAPRPRGKPRAEGNLSCDRCKRKVPKIRVHWPDGAICGICFTEAMHTYGRCAQCRSDRLLPGRSKSGKSICRDCAGIVRPIMICDQCGSEGERFRQGRCVRCVIEGDLEFVLKPNEPADLRIKKLVTVLTESRRPESIHTWMQGTKAKELLTEIGNRDLELTHEAFDARPYSAALEHIRAILIHNRLMVVPENVAVRRFEAWLNTRLEQLAPRPDVESVIEQFARWHHLPRIQKIAAETSRSLDSPTRNAKQEITEAGKFLIWLRDEHGRSPAEMTQWHIDLYLAGGTSTRRTIRNFVIWFRKGRGGKTKLNVSPRYAKSEPTISHAQRLQLIRNAADMDQVALSTRVAALIHLLWATPIARITVLKNSDVILGPDGMTIALGNTPAEIPESLAPLFWAHVSDPSNQQTTNVGTDWLFPGFRAGQPIVPQTLQERLRVLGIDPQLSRNAGLRNLTAQVDVRTLSELLGYSAITLANHAGQAGGLMSAYVEAKRVARAAGEPARQRFIPN